MDKEIVYIVKQKETNYVKIGITTEFKKKGRFAQLQTTSPTGIEIVNIFYVEDSKANERKLHSYFHKERLNGEWFKLTDNQLIEIKDLIIDEIELNSKWWLDFNIPLLGRHNKKVNKKAKRNLVTPEKFKTPFESLY